MVLALKARTRTVSSCDHRIDSKGPLSPQRDELVFVPERHSLGRPAAVIPK
jgi:hypothetical protein